MIQQQLTVTTNQNLIEIGRKTLYIDNVLTLLASFLETPSVTASPVNAKPRDWTLDLQKNCVLCAC